MDTAERLSIKVVGRNTEHNWLWCKLCSKGEYVLGYALIEPTNFINDIQIKLTERSFHEECVHCFSFLIR